MGWIRAGRSPENGVSPERTLLLLALIGGSLGALAGMIMFRHKTRKAKFFISVPVMFVVHCVIVAMLVYMK